MVAYYGRGRVYIRLDWRDSGCQKSAYGKRRGIESSILRQAKIASARTSGMESWTRPDSAIAAVRCRYHFLAETLAFTRMPALISADCITRHVHQLPPVNLFSSVTSATARRHDEIDHLSSVSSLSRDDETQQAPITKIDPLDAIRMIRIRLRISLFSKTENLISYSER